MLSGSNPQQQQLPESGGINFGLLQPLAQGLHQGVVGKSAPTASAQQGTGSMLSGLNGLVSGLTKAFAAKPSTAPAVTPAQQPNQGLIGGYVQNQLGMTPQTNTSQSLLGQQAAQSIDPDAEAMAKESSYKPNMRGIDPVMLQGAKGLMAELKAQGFSPVVAEGRMTPEAQAQKIREGNSQTMNSAHLTGKALDIVDSRYGWDDKHYPSQVKAFANAMATLAPKYGLESGTKWKSFGPYGDFANVHLPGSYGAAAMKQAQQEQQSTNKARQDAINGVQPSSSTQQTSSSKSGNTQVDPQQLQDQFNNHNLPRGVRNNNPGNLEIGGFTQSQPGFTKGADPRFASFATPEQGLGALSNLLTTKYNGQSLNTIISHYAPSSENDTQGYVNTLAKSAGIDPDKPIDMSNTATRTKVMQGIVQIENGKDPYSPDQYAQATAAQQQQQVQQPPQSAQVDQQQQYASSDNQGN